MSDLYEIFVDGDLRVVVYDYEQLATKIWMDMLYAATDGDVTLRQACEKIVLVRNGVRNGVRLAPPGN